MHRAQALSRAHEDKVLVHDQIGALHQLDAHLLGEVEVLVVRGVVETGRQEHDRRVVDAWRREPAQVAQELVHVALDRPHGVAGEQVRKDALHDVAVGQHIRGAGGRPQVVLEDEELALAVPYQVDAGDVAVDAVGDGQAFDLPHVEGAAEHDLGRDGALLEDQLAAVDVLEEEVQGGKALLQAGFEAPPGARRDDPRDDVEREHLLGPLLVRVDGEGDPVVPEHLEGQVVPALELGRAQAVEVLVQAPVAWSWLPGGRKHLVIEAVERVADV